VPGFGGYGGQPPGYQQPPQVGYPAPGVGYPVQAQPPLEGQSQGKRSSPWLIGGVTAAVLAIGGIGVGIVLAASGGSSAQTQLVATPVVAGTATTAAKASPSARPISSSNHHHSAPPASLPSTSEPSIASTSRPEQTPRATISGQVERESVEGTIRQEFALITEHKFSAAYALLAPSLQTGEAGWVASHRENGIYNVSVETTATINSPDSATASITKMRTLDGEGCKNWTGSWNLIKLDGEWRIGEANISPGSC
jgi:hypothetical protein